MRLTLASLPAALITLALFLLMQAMVSSPDRIPGHAAARNPVAFVSPRDLAGRRHEGAPATTQPPAPAALPPQPPLPRFTPPAPVQATARPPRAVEIMAAPPEFALDLGRLSLPRPAPATPVEPPRRVQTRPSTPAPTQARVEPAPAPAGREATGPAGDPDTSRNPGPSAASGSATEAVPVVRVEPKYPRKAARAGREGWVRLAFTITPSGGVADVRVLESEPPRLFDRSARQALERWRFRPHRVDGRAVSREAVQVIEFKLAGRG